VSRRPQIVWAAFIGAMTLVAGLLLLSDGGGMSGGLPLTMNTGQLTSQTQKDPLFDTDAPLDHARWTGIVIHHLGEPAGDAESIHRRHQSMGFDGLGYHFVIGNGNGMGDGTIEAGYRWLQQKPGAHVIGSAGRLHNHHSIGIVLIGNFDRREPTEAQMRSLTTLVRRLQRELSIPASAVVMHRDLVGGITSPGQFFPEAELREQLER
jgi:N-acetylmuramoyl-L-alanine amidase